MTGTVGDFVIERLKAWGVTRIFGYPGDGINGVMTALAKAKDSGIRFIQVRHEEMAAFMAAAHAKFTGEVGVCLSTGGPGATHLVTGLYDAALDHQPVVAICGQAAATVRGANYQQELNLDRLLADATEYVQEVAVPAQARHVIDRAFRIAAARRAPTAIILPNDVQAKPMEQPPRKHQYTRSSVGFAPARVLPPAEDLERAAAVLNAGEKVAILIGAGALLAQTEVIAVAEALGAGVAKALLGKAALPDTLPFVTGTIGLLGTKPTWDLMEGCDTLLMVGTNMPWAEFLPKDGQARAVQIDLEPANIGLRYPVEVPLHGDSALTLAALLPLLKPKTDRSWRTRIEKGVRDWWEEMGDRARAKADPVNPQLVVWEMSPRLPSDAIVTSDSGSCANWYARDWRVQPGQMGSLSGGLASMGAAVPYAIAAKFAHPARPVVALVGDGAMQMNNMAELITIQKYWREWDTPTLVVCVFNNEDLTEVTWEQRVMSGSPKFSASQDIPNVRYADFAKMIGLGGIFVDRPETLGPAWEEALAADRPTVLEVKTDPDIPPLPPHITREQAANFLSAMLGGDPERRHVLIDTIRQRFA